MLFYYPLFSIQIRIKEPVKSTTQTIEPGIYILDLKTGKSIWQEQILQLSSYKYNDIDYKLLGITDEEWKNRKIAIIQLGYQLNKLKYKFTILEDKYELFQMAYRIWQNENPDAKPKQRDYPLVIEYKEKDELGELIFTYQEQYFRVNGSAPNITRNGNYLEINIPKI